jgi:hypothetical protein
MRFRLASRISLKSGDVKWELKACNSCARVSRAFCSSTDPRVFALKVEAENAMIYIENGQCH